MHRKSFDKREGGSSRALGDNGADTVPAARPTNALDRQVLENTLVGLAYDHMISARVIDGQDPPVTLPTATRPAPEIEPDHWRSSPA